MLRFEWHRGGHALTIWNRTYTRSFNLQYCPMWERWHFSLSNNGGRLPHECFDLNLHVGRLAFSWTLWGIGPRWARLLRFLPDNARSRRGY